VYVVCGGHCGTEKSISLSTSVYLIVIMNPVIPITLTCYTSDGLWYYQQRASFK